MRLLTTAQSKRALIVLVCFHIIIIAASNYLVQIPFQVFGVITTWGTFSFPLVYLATDLTVRIFGSTKARKIVFGAMLPALLTSYVISILFFDNIARLSDKTSELLKEITIDKRNNPIPIGRYSLRKLKFKKTSFLIHL